jgi:hypothetical protein
MDMWAKADREYDYRLPMKTVIYKFTGCCPLGRTKKRWTAQFRGTGAGGRGGGENVFVFSHKVTVQIVQSSPILRLLTLYRRTTYKDVAQ